MWCEMSHPARTVRIWCVAAWLAGGRFPSYARAMSSEAEADRAVRRLLRSFRSVDSYGLVVVMIIVTYVACVSMRSHWGATIVLLVQIITVRLALHTSQAHRGLRLATDVLAVIAAGAAVVSLLGGGDDYLLRWVFLGSSALYFIAPFAMIRHIVFRRDVDRETMLGALGAYLLLGMAFGFAYAFLGSVQPSAFFGAHGDGDIADDLFFSYVTLTTTGYGNLVPAGNPGQSMAVLEALIGQLFLVTAVAKLVNAWKPRAWTGRESPTAEE